MRNEAADEFVKPRGESDVADVSFEIVSKFWQTSDNVAQMAARSK